MIPIASITDEGVIIPTESEVRDALLDVLSNAFGGGMSRELTTPQGQLATSLAYALNENNKAFRELANQFNPNLANGAFQDALGELYFLERMPARGTTVTAKCTGKAGTTIPKGSMAQDDNGNLYVSQSDALIGNDGFVNVVFVNEKTGAIPCVNGSLNRIYKQVIGWDSVINEASGVLGQDVESQRAFEQRRRESVALNSQNQNISIQASLLALNGVIDSFVYSNDSGAVERYGDTQYQIPAHSLVASVYGGSDDDIAQAIFNKKSAGCGTAGNVTKTIYIKDGYSDPFPRYNITFLRPKETDIYFKITLVRNETLPSDIIELVKDAVIAVFTGVKGNARARIGMTLNVGRYYADIASISDYVNIDAVQISKNGVNYSNRVIMGIDEMPVINRNNIEVIL